MLILCVHQEPRDENCLENRVTAEILETVYGTFRRFVQIYQNHLFFENVL